MSPSALIDYRSRMKAIKPSLNMYHTRQLAAGNKVEDIAKKIFGVSANSYRGWLFGDVIPDSGNATKIVEVLQKADLPVPPSVTRCLKEYPPKSPPRTKSRRKAAAKQGDRKTSKKRQVKKKSEPAAAKDLSVEDLIRKMVREELAEVLSEEIDKAISNISVSIHT